MKRSKWQAVALLSVGLAGAVPLPTVADARPSHRHRVHRMARHGEQTHPVIAGSASVRINSAGEVITDRHP